MTRNGNSGNTYVDRRRLLQAAGAVGVSALAGCSDNAGSDDGASDDGGSGDDSGSGDGSSGPEVREATMVSATNNGVPTNMHLNPIATQNYDDIVGAHVFERFVAYNFETQEFEMAGLEDWSVDGETFTLTIREDFNWENGEPVTARDLVTQFRLEKKTSGAIWDFAESVEEGGDEKTVVFELTEETNPRLLRYAIGSQSDRIYAYHPVYEEFLDQDASAVQQFEWEDDVVANGSFGLESKSEQAWTLTRNEEYYNAENVNFTELQILQRADNTALQQGMRGGELDAMSSMFAPPNIADSMPDQVQEINTPAKWGYGVVFNHEHEHFGNQNVRQAIAHVLNREEIAKNAGPRTKVVPEVATAIAVDDQERWLGDRMDRYETYGPGTAQTDAAAELLREAGYSRNDGVWEDEGGDSISAQFATPSGWTDWTTATNTVVDQLNSFGFDLEIDSKPIGDFYGDYVDSNFGLGAFYWLPGGARSSFPFYPLRWEMVCPDIDGGHGFPTGEKTLPAIDGSGEMTIDPLAEIREITSMTSDEDATEIIQRVAWHHNQTLPFIAVTEKQEQTWISGQRFDTPEADDPALGVKWATQWLPRIGEFTAAGN